MNGKYSNAINRWEGVGPYYAMFPAAFAKNVIKKYTKEGDSVLDPFVGRGTSIFAATTNGRAGFGIEINPVGWVYTKTKLSPASQHEVLKRLMFLDKISHRYKNEAKLLPQFFRYCYHPQVLYFLLAARHQLKWRSNKADTTLMALILINLHGKYGNALSNQMRQTKSMSPQYSIEWWREKKLRPPKIDPKDFFIKRIEWRYKNGVPLLSKNVVYLGDSSILLAKIDKQIGKKKFNRPRLLFTSPPYLGITNYYYDQWLRLWMLGHSAKPTLLKDRYKRKFDDVKEYSQLLEKVFKKSASLMHPKATIYVRTDLRKATYQITKNALLKAFPNKKLTEKTRMFHRPTQTQLFRKNIPNKDQICGGEVDLIMTP